LAIIITGVGAGIAAAMYLIGKSLPTFSEGLDSFSKIDGGNLVDVAKGIGALGIAMAAFGAGSAVSSVGTAFSSLVGGITKLFGGNDLIGTITETVKELSPVLPNLTALGNGLMNLSKGMAAYGVAINTIDIAKAEKVKDIIKGPSALESAVNASATAFSAAASSITSGKGSEEKTHAEIQTLNTTMPEVLKYVRETADYTKRTVDATKALNGNLFPAP